MGTIANAKVTHYYNCYNGDFIGCLHINILQLTFIMIVSCSIRPDYLTKLCQGQIRQ